MSKHIMIAFVMAITASQAAISLAQETVMPGQSFDFNTTTRGTGLDTSIYAIVLNGVYENDLRPQNDLWINLTILNAGDITGYSIGASLRSQNPKLISDVLDSVSFGDVGKNLQQQRTFKFKVLPAFTGGRARFDLRSSNPEYHRVLYCDLTRVWPGDTNNDGIVNQVDVLPIGLYWNRIGPQRPGASTSWAGQLVLSWAPAAGAFANANGNNRVDQADVLPLGLNWSRTHSVAQFASEGVSHPQTKPAFAAGTLKTEVTGNSNPGQEFFADIIAENVADLFGLSFELSYSPTTFVDPQAAEAGSLMGNDVIFFPNIDKPAGKISIGVSRKAGQGAVNGTGVVARVRMRMSTSAVSGRDMTCLRLDNVTANDPNGNTIALALNNPRCFTTTVETGQSDDVPEQFALHAGYPNPLRASGREAALTISYDLPEPAAIKIEIFDVMGKHVSILMDQRQSAGRYMTTWNGLDEKGASVPAGIYFYRLQTAKFTKTQKLMLLR